MCQLWHPNKNEQWHGLVLWCNRPDPENKLLHSPADLYPTLNYGDELWAEAEWGSLGGWGSALETGYLVDTCIIIKRSDFRLLEYVGQGGSRMSTSGSSGHAQLGGDSMVDPELESLRDFTYHLTWKQTTMAPLGKCWGKRCHCDLILDKWKIMDGWVDGRLHGS